MSLSRMLNRLIIPLSVAIAAIVCCSAASAQRSETNLSGAGWHLWLDKQAAWKDDTLHLPPVELKSLPVNPPTIGWQAMYSQGMQVSTPGTVEEYYWDTISAERRKTNPPDALDGDYTGVSWWWRDITVPKSASGKRVVLHFEAVRLRAEVFLNGKLVGYDVIGNTPFDVDLTGKTKPGTNKLAVRITDPSGNFIWFDPEVDSWGKYKIPNSHGFGGITGPSKLVITDPVNVSDIFIKNRPSIKSIDVDATITNATNRATKADVEFRISVKKSGKVVKTAAIKGATLKPGETTLTKSISVPSAKAWDLEHPNLYTCTVKIVRAGKSIDTRTEPFGFRWFTADGIGKDAMFRLNGKRVVLRSAISWGFWPTNGIYPTEKLAVRQITTAKALGQNMVNFHRCIGNRLCLDKADQLGMFYYEEPGGYECRNGDGFAFAWAREKLLRMVKHDRNHPSLIIYTMINETGGPMPVHMTKDLIDAHKLDPSRVINYTSGWAKQGDDPTKSHLRPYDDKIYISGWYDEHHALGPGVYSDNFYQDPKQFYLYTPNKEEIVFWGEEGAISTPPRLQKIAKEIDEYGRNGWDGAWYKTWYQAYEKYLDEKNMRKYFPTVDSLTESMGNISHYYQAKIIEGVRAGNVTDGYVVNGWESELVENHSGIVDCWRNPKGDPSIMGSINRPVCVAVKIRNKVMQVPDRAIVDFYILNEVDLKGSLKLVSKLIGPDGKKVSEESWPVKISGGDVYGELLIQGAKIDIPSTPGRYKVEATIVDNSGKTRADGVDEVFAVDWKSAPIPPNGAVAENGKTISTFLETQKNVPLPAYSPTLGKLDYVVLGDFEPGMGELIPADCLATPDGKPGLQAEYFSGIDFDKSVVKSVDPRIDFRWDGRPPEPGVPADTFSVRWTGKVIPKESGEYTFGTLSDDGVRLWVDGRLVIDRWGYHGATPDVTGYIRLEAGKPVDIKMEYFNGSGGSVIQLSWATPAMTAAGSNMMDGLLSRVKNDGTTLLFIDGAANWSRVLVTRGIINFAGTMDVGDVWMGGNLFVRDHPLFKDLPVNQGLNWEYQSLVNYGAKRYGLMLEGEEAVVGTVNTNEPRLGTAVGVIPYGKGKIVLSTLDIVRQLDSKDDGANVVRKLFCNYLEYAAEK